jgi:pyruvate dehydrogenase E2 component (dihydrolipoamide acetyltransferase)
MSTVVRMPELAANTPDATLVEWLVSEGAEVAAGDPIASAETAKATVDIPADVGGRILQLIAVAGSDIAVGAPIAVIGAAGESLTDVDLGVAGHGAAGPPTQISPPPTAEQAAEQRVTAPNRSASAGPAQLDERSSARIFASPLARKHARDAGLELSDIVGTGPGGRIVRGDVAAALKRRTAPDTRTVVGLSAPPQKLDLTVNGHDTPHTRLRRTIASRLTESKRTTPHFYVRGSARVDALLALREQINQHASPRISVNDLVVLAVARAHQRSPRMNVIWTEDAIRRFDTVDVAVAVATSDGLVTPVARSVDSMNLSALAMTTRDFAERARDGKLRPDELDGGSVTVTNLGMFGIEDFAAIINPPHSAILAVGAARESVVVEHGQCVVARTMNFTLSVDHRPIDGATAAQWVQEFTALLEDPLQIVI